VNACVPCGEDFSSVRLFDRHRVGLHEFTLSEGLRMDPPREDGRRCLATDEMAALGWERNARGQWFDPVDARRIRDHHARALSGVRLATETPSEPPELLPTTSKAA
jgi:hypothetical protein